jgi:hypothetical protein
MHVRFRHNWDLQRCQLSRRFRGIADIKCAWFDRTDLRVHGLADGLSEESDGSVEPQLGDMAGVLL